MILFLMPIARSRTARNTDRASLAIHSSVWQVWSNSSTTSSEEVYIRYVRVYFGGSVANQLTVQPDRQTEMAGTRLVPGAVHHA